MEINEKETLAMLEAAKAHYIESAQESFQQLAVFLAHDLAHSEVVERKLAMFVAQITNALMFSNLVDSFLDYFSQHGAQDGDITEAALVSLAETIKQILQEEALQEKAGEE